MKVATLLPAATEIVAALGMLDHVVAVSHECDFPPEVRARPRATHCPIHESGLPSAEVDRWVTDSLQQGGTLYTLDE
ncbi:MAG: cobalamin-binding protein, partial [Deltaproteobacteria bacterium]